MRRGGRRRFRRRRPTQQTNQNSTVPKPPTPEPPTNPNPSPSTPKPSSNTNNTESTTTKITAKTTIDFSKLYDQTEKACVSIRTDDNRSGSGCFVTGNTILTAHHVVPSGIGETASILVMAAAGNRIIRTRVTKICPPFDLALLTVLDTYTHEHTVNIHPKYWQKVNHGDPVFGIHYSLGVEHASMSTGVVRENRFQITEHALDILTDHSTQPGSSGSPIFGVFEDKPVLVGQLQYGFVSSGVPLPTYGGGVSAPLIHYFLQHSNSTVPVLVFRDIRVRPMTFAALNRIYREDPSIRFSHGPLVFMSNIPEIQADRSCIHSVDGLKLGTEDMNSPCIQETLYASYSPRSARVISKHLRSGLSNSTDTIVSTPIAQQLVSDRPYLSLSRSIVRSIDAGFSIME